MVVADRLQETKSSSCDFKSSSAEPRREHASRTEAVAKEQANLFRGALYALATAALLAT